MRGFCLVNAGTDFMATPHDPAGSATTLYSVPVCPSNFQLAPMTWPHSFPNEGGSPPTAEDAVVATTGTATSVRSERQVTRLSPFVLSIVEFLSIGEAALGRALPELREGAVVADRRAVPTGWNRLEIERRTIAPTSALAE